MGSKRLGQRSLLSARLPTMLASLVLGLGLLAKPILGVIAGSLIIGLYFPLFTMGQLI